MHGRIRANAVAYRTSCNALPKVWHCNTLHSAPARSIAKCAALPRPRGEHRPATTPSIMSFAMRVPVIDDIQSGGTVSLDDVTPFAPPSASLAPRPLRAGGAGNFSQRLRQFGSAGEARLGVLPVAQIDDLVVRAELQGAGIALD